MKIVQLWPGHIHNTSKQKTVNDSEQEEKRGTPGFKDKKRKCKFQYLWEGNQKGTQVHVSSEGFNV